MLGSVKKTYEEINEKIKKGQAVIVTAEEIIGLVAEKGTKEAAAQVDVVTTGTFGPMCSSGAFFNFGHAEPPIRMNKVWLNSVPAYAGIAAVDAYLGATELSEMEGIKYGGAHVLQDLISGKKVKLKATSYGTDCYPRREIEGYIDLASINQAILFNPRNAYQNYSAATNTSERTLYTYMGILLPRTGNVTFATSGQLSPLLNDPTYRTIGIGTRIFLGGTTGYVAWEGTQHNPSQLRDENGIPLGGAATLSLIGNLKEMNPAYLRAAIFEGYGVSLFVGIGIPIPILDEDMIQRVAVSDADLYTSIYDYSVPSRQRPALARVNYQQLRSGQIELNGKLVRTAPLSSYIKAREIAELLKKRIKQGDFLLQEPVQGLPQEGSVNTLNPLKGEA